MEMFYKHLGSDVGDESKIAAGGDDSEWEKKCAPRLFGLSDSTGKVQFTEVELKDGKANISMFNSDDAYIFDIGAEIFVWIGKGASEAERELGLQYADQYVKDNNKNPKLPVCKIYEGGENEVFFAALN
jgi:gelsolin